MQSKDVSRKFKSAFEAKLALQTSEPKDLVKKKVANSDNYEHIKSKFKKHRKAEDSAVSASESEAQHTLDTKVFKNTRGRESKADRKRRRNNNSWSSTRDHERRPITEPTQSNESLMSACSSDVCQFRKKKKYDSAVSACESDARCTLDTKVFKNLSEGSVAAGGKRSKKDCGGSSEASQVECLSKRNTDIQVHDRFSFSTLEDDAVVLLIKPGCQVAIKGITRIRCIHGHVRVQGFSLSDTNQKYYPLYSSDSHCLLTLSGGSDFLSNDTSVLMKLLKDEFSTASSDALQQIVDNARIYTCALILRKLFDVSCDFVTQFSPFETLFLTSKKGRTDECPSDEGSVLLREIGCEIPAENASDQFITSKDYEDVANQFLKLLKSSSSPVIAMCGGKNMGKSTLGRYLINQSLGRMLQNNEHIMELVQEYLKKIRTNKKPRLFKKLERKSQVIINVTLHSVSSIAYMECDLGQTEFTPPGCVALHLLTEPVLGPPFTHQREAVSMCFVGAVQPSDDPRHYIHCLQHVFSAYARMQPRPPLIVNTMGWNKGLGLSLLIDAFRITLPNIIVQIDGEGGQSKNLPEMTTQFLTNPPFWVNDLSVIKVAQSKAQHRLIKIKSHVQNQSGGSALAKFMPADHRSMSLLSHLGRAMTDIYSPSLSFLAVTPYRIAWKDVAVHVCHARVPRSQILYALNVSVVALCIVDNSLIVNSGITDYPKFLKGNPVCDCLGFGVVRSIDEESKSFYVITSLAPSLLENVNCLIRGTIEIPNQLLLTNQAHHSGSGLPYVGQPKDVTGATAIKRRRHMLRRSSGSDRTGLPVGCSPSRIQ